MPRRKLPGGLYLITPDERDGERLLARTLPLLPFASCLQLRAKDLDGDTLLMTGLHLRTACRDANVTFIVNDDPRLARELDADGVHLGADDASVGDARQMLGDAAIIGVSCYTDIDRARLLAAEGADYLAFGAFSPSPTKPNACRASPVLLRDSAALGLPRVAIGGITPENGGSLIAAGADLLAIISGVYDAFDPVVAARAYHSLFRNRIPEDPTP
jgi:thiamine-phosphate pyrophosphorylase